MRELLRRGDFRLLLLALVLTMFGDRALILANGIWVKSLTGSNALAGLNILLLVAPSVVSPFFGILVDRVRRRPFLIVLNLSCATAILPLLLVDDAGDVWLIYLVSFGYGVALLLNDAAVNGVLKTMLSEDQLASANGVIQTMREGLRLLVPLAGAGLFAVFGGHAVVVLDVATLALGAGVLALLKLREPPAARAEHRLVTEMVAGLRHLFLGTVRLRRLVLTCSVALLVVGFSETTVFAVIDALHRPPAFFGVLMSAQGVGAIAGGVTAAPLVRRVGEQLTAAAGLALFGTGTLLLTLPTLSVVLVGFVVCGVGLPWLLVAFYTLMQRETPHHLVGRVGTAAEVLLGGPQTLSIGLGAIFITIVDYRILLVTMATVLCGCGIFLLVRRGSRRREPDPVVRTP